MNGLTELARFIDPHLGRSQERLDDAVGAEDISEIYNWAGDEYGLYAGGDSKRLFCFAGLQAYADRHLWEVLEKKLNEFRAAGRGAIKLLDARCAPGAWLRRCVTHAYRHSFSQIAARGFDAARVQIETAHRMTASLAALPGIDLTFEVADITDPLPGADASVDRAHQRFSNSATSILLLRNDDYCRRYTAWPHSGHLPDVQRVSRAPAADAGGGDRRLLPDRKLNRRNLHDPALSPTQVEPRPRGLAVARRQTTGLENGIPDWKSVSLVRRARKYPPAPPAGLP